MEMQDVLKINSKNILTQQRFLFFTLGQENTGFLFLKNKQTKKQL